MKALHQSTTSGMAYRDEGHGRPILLIHGWGVSAAMFAAQTESLAAHFRVVAVDLRGHGQSVPYTDGMRFGQFADDVAALISELGLEDVCLVGWSMGAMVAWDLLLRYPQASVAGLVTIDMVPRLLNKRGWPHGLRDGEDTRVFDRNTELMLSNWAAYVDLFVPKIFAAQPAAATQPAISSTHAVALGNRAEDMARIWGCMAGQDFRAELSRIKLPTLVISGKQSQLYSEAAGAWLCRQMPAARQLVFVNSGHAPHMEEPELFNRQLSEFAHHLPSRPVRPTNNPAPAGTES